VRKGALHLKQLRLFGRRTTRLIQRPSYVRGAQTLSDAAWAAGMAWPWRGLRPPRVGAVPIWPPDPPKHL